jgi:phage baseplate assembly protein gpV
MMLSTVKPKPVRLLIAALLAAALFAALVASDAQAALRHFDGTVLSKDRAAHTFRIKAENGNRVRFRVNGKTEFERIPGGFRGLHRGLRVEVNAKRTSHGFVAKHVEKHRRGGGHGGGGDDGPNHG